ncbi:MAG: hypothetical protein CL579_06950 [Alteromonadaceae bacterium]|jgi:hypothetical protein|nr:hypothetical protein [Alteromonadaceae bacterium]MBB20136.1 hypothetical protein [Rickettsiales bacterium]
MANTIAVVKRSTLCLLISGVFSNVLSAQSHSLDVDSVAPTTCPTDFHGIEIPADASACLLFADALPASLTYHSKQTPNDLIALFRQHIDGPISQSLSQNRILMRLQNDYKIIVISPDETGSQVGILINPR